MRIDPDDVATPAWSDARVDLLRLHHALGLSAALSAQLIGEVTKNAVISKRRRLGLVGANPFQAARRVRCDDRPLDRLFDWFPRRTPIWRPITDEAAIPREPLPFMDWPAPADADPKTVAGRGPGQCAWPLGPAEAEGDYLSLFCCAPVQRGRSYCPAHQACATAAPAPAPAQTVSAERRR